MSLLQLCYLVSVLPFEDLNDNYLEIFNESSILLVMNFHLAFVIGVGSLLAVFNFGYVVIGLILMNILANVIMFLITNVSLIYRKLIRP